MESAQKLASPSEPTAPTRERKATFAFGKPPVLPERDADGNPRAKIDLADALTLFTRLFAGILLGGIAAMYVVIGQWRMVLGLVFLSTMMILWAMRLISKMRSENAEYIAYRATLEAQERERKTVSRPS